MTTNLTAIEEATRNTVVEIIMDEPIGAILNGLLALGYSRAGAVEIVKVAQARAGLED